MSEKAEVSGVVLHEKLPLPIVVLDEEKTISRKIDIQ